MGQPDSLEQPAKVIGIIAEYNPFHGGHKFQIEEAKKRTGADWCVAAMSGDFVQRGEPAVYSKYLRTRMALSCGVDVLCFGSEDGDIRRIRTAAGILAQEGEDFSSLLSIGLRSGLSWPQARSQALLKMADKDKDFPLKREEMDKLLGSPNNLLGIEYCKAILRQNSPLIPFTIRRRGQGYHDNGLEGGQASASAIRRTLKAGVPSGEAGLFPYAKLTPEAMTHIPPEIRSLYGREPVLEANDLSEILNFCLLSLKREGTDYTQYGDMSAEMARRLEHCLLKQVSWEGRIEQLKTRQYTYTRLSRALLHMVLGLTDARVQSYK